MLQPGKSLTALKKELEPIYCLSTAQHSIQEDINIEHNQLFKNDFWCAQQQKKTDAKKNKKTTTIMNSLMQTRGQ